MNVLEDKYLLNVAFTFDYKVQQIISLNKIIHVGDTPVSSVLQENQKIAYSLKNDLTLLDSYNIV